MTVKTVKTIAIDISASLFHWSPHLNAENILENQLI